MHKRQSTHRLMLMNLATALMKYADNPKATANASLARNIVRILFDLAGFALLTIAGFTVSSLAGYIVAGLSCFVLSRHLTAKDTPNPDPMMR